ncbi:DUF982 domain-containing protein [Rhizobium ruizarguesonis]|nr:DUF982 domain-containing protein [Rhizobium ruizarguesonis]
MPAGELPGRACNNCDQEHRKLSGRRPPDLEVFPHGEFAPTDGWPVDDGEEYLIAIRACRDAIHGEVPSEDAREALIRAADEAGISVITVVH